VLSASRKSDNKNISDSVKIVLACSSEIIYSKLIVEQFISDGVTVQFIILKFIVYSRFVEFYNE